MHHQDPRLFKIAVGVYVSLWLLLASPWLNGNLTIPYDAKAHFQAQIQFLANALHSGQSPFWAPHVFAGTPQVADPQSLIFSPALLLAYFNAVPSFRAVDAYALGLLGLGGLAILMLFRERGWHPAGGVIAALAFSFGASAAWRIQHLGQVQSYALFAIALALLDRALRRGSAAWGMAAGLAAGLMLMEPNQVALLASYVLGLLVVERWLTGEGGVWRSLRRSRLPLICAGTTAIAIAGMPLLLTYLFVADSSRPEIALVEAARGSLHPASLLTLVVSDLFGAFDPKVEYWGPFSDAWDASELTLSQNMSQLYIGALPAFLILTVGLARGYLGSREARGLALATVALVVYAVGRHTPVFPALYETLPGVALFRRPADATFLIGALLAVLGGYVLHRVITDLGPRRRSWQASMAVPAAALLLALGTAFQMGKLAVAWQPVAMAALWMSASAATVWIAPALARRSAALAVVAPALLLAADLAAGNGPNESTALPVKQYDILNPEAGNATIGLLKSLLASSTEPARRDRVELTGLGFEWPNAPLVHGIDHVLGYNPLRLDVITRGVGAGDTIAGPDQRRFTPLFPSYRSKLADLLGLRYIATSVPIETIDRRLEPGALPLVGRTRDAYIYENRTALPRAMLVRDWQLADFDAVLRTGEWPADPASTVLLEVIPQGGPRTIPAAVRSLPAQEASFVRIVRYENTVIEIEVDSSAPGFLILNDVWHPWWAATVNGEEATILKANVLFRAVEVRAGHNRVRFEFRPFTKAIEQVLQPVAERPYHVSLARIRAAATAP